MTTYCISQGTLLNALWWPKWVKVKVAQSCLTLSHPMDCSPPGSSIHGIGLLARPNLWFFSSWPTSLEQAQSLGLIYIAASPVIVIQEMVDVTEVAVVFNSASILCEKHFLKWVLSLDISYTPLSYLLIQSFKCCCLLSDQIKVTRKPKLVSPTSPL